MADLNTLSPWYDAYVSNKSIVFVKVCTENVIFENKFVDFLFTLSEGTCQNESKKVFLTQND